MTRNRETSLKRKRRQAQEMTKETGQIYEVHHRHPRSRKRSYKGHINEERNLCLLPYEKHKAWHLLINGNELPPEFVKRLNEEYMPPDWYLVAVPRKRPPKRKRRTKAYCNECESLVLCSIPRKPPRN